MQFCFNIFIILVGLGLSRFSDKSSVQFVRKYIVVDDYYRVIQVYSYNINNMYTKCCSYNNIIYMVYHRIYVFDNS